MSVRSHARSKRVRQACPAGHLQRTLRSQYGVSSKLLAPAYLSPSSSVIHNCTDDPWRAALFVPSSGHTGAKLAMHGQRLARAWRAYPSIFAVQEQRSRRIIPRQTLREGYVAELAAGGTAPVSVQRVLRDPQVICSNAGWMTTRSAVTPPRLIRGPRFGDQERLRACLGGPFAQWMLERILGQPSQLSPLERFNRSRS